MVHIKKILVNLVGILAFLFIFTYGCHPLQSSLPGIYVSNEENSVDSIFLYNNSQYTHKVLVQDSLKTQKGRWDYSYGTIRLYDFKSFEGDLPIGSGTWITNVNISYKGTVEIGINSDTDDNYVKIKPL